MPRDANVVTVIDAAERAFEALVQSCACQLAPTRDDCLRTLARLRPTDRRGADPMLEQAIATAMAAVRTLAEDLEREHRHAPPCGL